MVWDVKKPGNDPKWGTMKTVNATTATATAAHILFQDAAVYQGQEQLS
jgi:hypothetical protein